MNEWMMSQCNINMMWKLAETKPTAVLTKGRSSLHV